MDFGWFLTRLYTHQSFSENLHNRDGEVFQPLPSWSGFNAKIASEPPLLTFVAYCQMINVSPTEYSTVYTVSKEDSVKLRNIATEVVIPHEAAEQLVDCFSIGAEEAKKFRRQRMDSDEVSFWSKISRLNLKTFASLAKTNQIKCADEKIITFSADRNLFGRLLIAVKCRDVDVKEVLRYELSTVPFTFAHADGSLRKTTKSVLMAEVERECQAQGRLPESAL